MRRPRFALVLEALPSPHDVPPDVRLRHLLKRALRDWQLKCLEIVELRDEVKGPEEGKPCPSE